MAAGILAVGKGSASRWQAVGISKAMSDGALGIPKRN